MAGGDGNGGIGAKALDFAWKGAVVTIAVFGGLITVYDRATASGEKARDTMMEQIAERFEKHEGTDKELERAFASLIARIDGQDLAAREMAADLEAVQKTVAEVRDIAIILRDRDERRENM